MVGVLALRTTFLLFYTGLGPSSADLRKHNNLIKYLLFYSTGTRRSRERSRRVLRDDFRSYGRLVHNAQDREEIRLHYAHLRMRNHVARNERRDDGAGQVYSALG